MEELRLPRLKLEENGIMQDESSFLDKLAEEIKEYNEADVIPHKVMEAVHIAQVAASKVYHMCEENGFDVKDVNSLHVLNEKMRGRL